MTWTWSDYFLQKEMKLSKLLSLNLSKLTLLIGDEILSIILHNFIGAFLGVEEVLFFILAVFLTPSFLVIAALFTACIMIAKCFKSKNNTKVRGKKTKNN